MDEPTVLAESGKARLTPPEPGLAVGDRVQLVQAPAYFKTADPMPMLRPPDIVALEETGVITEQRVGQSWVVKFQRGSFLLDTAYLAKIP